MAGSCTLLPVALALVLLARHGPLEAFVSPPQPACGTQTAASICGFPAPKCGDPCKGLRQRPAKPDASFDASGAVESIALGGLAVLRSKFFDDALKSTIGTLGALSGWGYIGTGVLDGVEGKIDVEDHNNHQDDAAAWNLYHLERFISANTDYVICEIKNIVGEYFESFVGDQDLCHYNLGVNAMAHTWISSCSSRQCLNLTDRASDRRGDCCAPSDGAGNNGDCNRYSDEQITLGQGLCRLQDENFPPGSGVCSTKRVCRYCMDFNKAIEMTRAQIDRYSEPPTNWGAALQGYNNIDAVVAQVRGTLMMMSFYQELILLGAEGSIDNYMEFAKGVYQQMQVKVDRLSSTAPFVVENFSCTARTSPVIFPDLSHNPCVSASTNFCVISGRGCMAPTMLGMTNCELEVCNEDNTCSGCAASSGCNLQDACWNVSDNLEGCSDWTATWQAEKKRAMADMKSKYDDALANVSSFLRILQNYSLEKISSRVFGAYLRIGYRNASCVAGTASPQALAKCQHDQSLSSLPGLPHSQFHP